MNPSEFLPWRSEKQLKLRTKTSLAWNSFFCLKKVGSMRYVPFYFYLKTIAHQFRIRDDDEPLREGIAAVESAVLAADGVILLP